MTTGSDQRKVLIQREEIAYKAPSWRLRARFWHQNRCKKPMPRTNQRGWVQIVQAVQPLHSFKTGIEFAKSGAN